MNRYYISKMPGHPAFLIVLAESIADAVKFLDANRIIYGAVFPPI